MDIPSFILLQLVVALSAYVQSTIGFGLGMLLMAGIVSFQLLPLMTAVNFAVIVNLLSIIVALKGQYMTKAEFKKMPYFLALIPTTILGFILFSAMGQDMDLYNILYAMLAIVILVGAVAVMVPVKQGTGQSPQWVFYSMFSASGVIGGMFGAAGVPIIYIVSRQPWDVSLMRRVMLAGFATALTVRLLWSGMYAWPVAEFILVLKSAPMIIAASLLGRHHQSKVNLQMIRYAAFVLLTVSGVQILLRVYTHFSNV